MTLTPEIEALLKRIKEERLRDFSNPDFDVFRSSYQCSVPTVLVELYSLGEALLKTGCQFESLWVESFRPLSANAIQESAERYGRQFYQFAVGDEGQAYLLRISDPASVWMDNDSDGKLVEALPASMECLVNEAKRRFK